MFKKRPVKRISVKFVATKTGENWTRDYVIPDGGKYKIKGLWGGLSILDRYGVLIKQVEFQAGFTIEFDFLY